MTTDDERAEKPGTGDAPEPAVRLLDHEYDGIREYDNPLPRWWVAIFWCSFFFAVGYFFYFHVTGTGTSISAAYADEMREVQAEQAKRAMAEKVSEDVLAALMKNPTVIQSAQKLFTERCQACHAENGKGLIGPNLTDNYWIHGKGRLMDIYQVVHDGVPDKGMPSWGRMLSPTELREAVAFVGTLRGKNLPGKAPQGNPIGP